MMRSLSFLSSVVSAAGLLLSGAVAAEGASGSASGSGSGSGHGSGHGVTTVVLQNTVTTCPPSLSDESTSTRTVSSTATVTFKPPHGNITASWTRSWSATRTWSSVSVSVSPTTSPKPPVSCNDFWLDNVKHQGLAPFAGAGYKVFRNVRDYGAKGDGETDDTAAINRAISEGNRCGPGCTGSTTTPALVYFPPGTYIVTAPLIDYYYTQIIGNPLCLPVIKAASSFTARFLLDTNPYDTNGRLAWGATNVFFRQVANLVLDLTSVDAGVQVAAVHWPSSQATSLTNIVFKLSQTKGNRHQGLFIEEGSGGYVGDLVFEGGAQALNVGNQQFTMRNLTIRKAQTAVKQLWSWGWTYQAVTIDSCEVGFDFTNVDQGELKVGSAVIFDSDISNTPVGVVYGNDTVTQPVASNNIILENVRLSNVPVAVQGPNKSTVLAGTTGTSTIAAWGRNFVEAASFEAPNRPASLVSGTDYYVRSKPQYTDEPASSFLSARAAGAKGDGVADDTAALNALLVKAAASNKIVFLDAGYYRVTSTIKIPPGSRIFGEALPIILSSGAFFGDASNPRPVVQIGTTPGQAGSIEWSNTVVSTKGAQPGAILIEYNLASLHSGKAPSGLWEVHVRIGGFAGSDLQLPECAKTPNITITAANLPTQCVSGFLSFHITAASSGLLMENCWIWVADHDLEIGANNQQITVYSGRGLLIESEAGGIWLYGTGVEHHQLYEYQLINTQDLVMGQIQTETAYYQPNPFAGIPFASVEKYHDPEYTEPESGLGLRIVESAGILVYGAGLYSFFDNYNVSCSQIGVTSENKCQKRIFEVERSDVVVYNLNTVGTEKMITEDGVDVADWADYVDGFVQTVLVYIYNATHV